MTVIKIDHLTKDYGYNRGVFDISLEVQKGEVYGFLGPNGAGKTTAIRHIMGFSRPQKGLTFVKGLNSWENASEIQHFLGYLPGEIAFPENLTGEQFIRMMAELRGMKEMSYTHNLIKKFELDPSGSLKRMALGMKRKLAIVRHLCMTRMSLFWMNQQVALIRLCKISLLILLKRKRKRGKRFSFQAIYSMKSTQLVTKFRSLKMGRSYLTFIADDLRHHEEKTFKFEFMTKDDFEEFSKEIQFYPNIEVVSLKLNKYQATVHFNDADIQ